MSVLTYGQFIEPILVCLALSERENREFFNSVGHHHALR